MEVCKTKHIVHHLQTSQTIDVHINLSDQRNCNFEEIKKMLAFPKLQQLEHVEIVKDEYNEIDIKTAVLEKIVSFSIESGETVSGIFLPDGNMLFSQKWSPGKNRSKCILFERNGMQIKQISIKQAPACVRLDGEEIFITCSEYAIINAISSKSFRLICSFSIT